MEVNDTLPCDYRLYDGFQVIYAELPLSLIIICESVLTICVIWRNRSLHTNQNIFIASLAFSDLLQSFAFGIDSCVHLLLPEFFFFSRTTMGTVVLSAIFGSATTSGIHMSIIAIDRYIQIAHPFYYIRKMTKTRISKILLCVWIVGLINAAISVKAYRDDKYNTKCINLNQPFEYYCANFAIVLTNVVIVVFCYFRIAKLAFKHKKASIVRSQIGQPNATVMFRNISVAFMKSFKFFVTMCSVYFACTIPIFLLGAIVRVQYVPNIVVSLISYLLPLHCVLNFCICCSMNQSFRTALIKTFVDLKSCLY